MPTTPAMVAGQLLTSLQQRLQFATRRLEEKSSARLRRFLEAVEQFQRAAVPAAAAHAVKTFSPKGKLCTHPKLLLRLKSITKTLFTQFSAARTRWKSRITRLLSRRPTT